MIFGILGFFQKTNKQIRFFGLTVLKANLFVRFLEESEDTKKSFRNYLTFTYNYNSAWTHDNTFLCKTLLFEFSMSDIPLNPWELILANTNSFFQVCNFVFMYNIIHFLHILLSAWYKKVPRNVQTYIDLIATKHLQKSFWFNLA